MRYLDYEDLLCIYVKTVEISGGGAKGVIDEERAKSILEQIKNDDYYPNIENKLTHLFFWTK